MLVIYRIPFIIDSMLFFIFYLLFGGIYDNIKDISYDDFYFYVLYVIIGFM